MTNREFFTAIIESEVSDELKNFATEAIAKLDKRNTSRASKLSKTAIANAPIKEAIIAYLREHGQTTASTLATELGITTAKASALATQLKKEGLITTAYVKVKGKGRVNGYSIES